MKLTKKQFMQVEGITHESQASWVLGWLKSHGLVKVSHEVVDGRRRMVFDFAVCLGIQEVK